MNPSGYWSAPELEANSGFLEMVGSRLCSVAPCKEWITVTKEEDGWLFVHGENMEARTRFTALDLTSGPHVQSWVGGKDNTWFNPLCPVCAWLQSVHTHQAGR